MFYYQNRFYTISVDPWRYTMILADKPQLSHTSPISIGSNCNVKTYFNKLKSKIINVLVEEVNFLLKMRVQP